MEHQKSLYMLNQLEYDADMLSTPELWHYDQMHQQQELLQLYFVIVCIDIVKIHCLAPLTVQVRH